jgi:hypothetical protein
MSLWVPCVMILQGVGSGKKLLNHSKAFPMSAAT